MYPWAERPHLHVRIPCVLDLSVLRWGICDYEHALLSRNFCGRKCPVARLESDVGVSRQQQEADSLSRLYKREIGLQAIFYSGVFLVVYSLCFAHRFINLAGKSNLINPAFNVHHQTKVLAEGPNGHFKNLVLTQGPNKTHQLVTATSPLLPNPILNKLTTLSISYLTLVL